MTYKPYIDIREFTRGHPQQVDWLTVAYYPDLHQKSLEEIADIDQLIASLYNIVNCCDKDEYYEGLRDIDWQKSFIKDTSSKVYTDIMYLIDKECYTLAKNILFRMSCTISSHYESIYPKSDLEEE